MMKYFIIGTEKDYEERLSEVKKLFKEEKDEFTYTIDYKFKEDEPRAKDGDIAYMALESLVCCDKVYYMTGWEEEPICKFLDLYAKMVDMSYMNEECCDHDVFTADDL